MSNRKIKKLLIIESKLIHWTTVEPLIVCFLKKGWKVEVIIPGPFISIFEHYSKLHDLKKYIENLTLKDYNDTNFVSLLFRSTPDISIVANRLFWEKPISKSFFRQISSNIRLIFRSITKLLLIHYYLRKSYFVITTHFVDAIELPNKCFTTSKITNFFLKRVWDKSKQDSHAINVYSSLVKENIVNPENKNVFLAPNAIYRYAKKVDEVAKKDNYLIIIPGRIDTRRRDYKWIDKIDISLKDKLEIIFIGKAQTDDDLDIVKQLERKGFNQYVKKTNQFIDFDEFDSYLERADLFFVPLVELEEKNRKIDRNLGAFFDSIRYGKPLIVPSYIPIPSELMKSCITYDNNSHLNELIEQIIYDEIYRDCIKCKAHENSMNWVPDQMKYYGNIEKQLL